MTKTNVHVFIGSFNSRAKANDYTQEQWEPEPDESTSDQEYYRWEERNPIWKMRDDLNYSMDSDFIEIITDKTKFNYFKEIVQNENLSEKYWQVLNSNGGTLILIFEKALSNKEAKLQSTNQIEYVGKFAIII